MDELRGSMRKQQSAPSEAGEARGPGLERRRPRSYAEWSALSRWDRLPAWEPRATGYLLRSAREGTGLTQAEMAERLGVTQQAVAQAERWDSNPTVRFLASWAEALGTKFELSFERPGRRVRRRSSSGGDPDLEEGRRR